MNTVLKTSLTLILFFSIFNNTSFAQQWSFGAVGGTVHSGLAGSDTTTSQWNPTFGALAVFSSQEGLGATQELLYTQKGGQYTVIDEGAELETQQAKLFYIEYIPQAVVFLRDEEDDFRPKISIGPTFSYLIGGSAGNRSVKGDFNPFDIGASLTAGFYQVLGKGNNKWLNFSVRYTLGLAEIAKRETVPDKFNINTLSFTLGLNFACKQKDRTENK